MWRYGGPRRAPSRDKRVRLWYFHGLCKRDGVSVLKKNWLYFLVAFAGPLLAIFWWVGGFASASIETNQMRGPYHYAYLEHSGDYAKLPERQFEALRALQAQNVAHGAAFTLMMTDPRATAMGKRSAQTGYLVEAGVSVKEPLQLGEVPARSVLVTSVRAHPRLAVGKGYAALLRYLDGHGMKLAVPTVEIYQNNTLTIEMNL